MRPSAKRILSESKGDIISMGEYGDWELVGQRETFGWWAKRVKGEEPEFAVILFFPEEKPGFAPPLPAKQQVV